MPSVKSTSRKHWRAEGSSTDPPSKKSKKSHTKEKGETKKKKSEAKKAKVSKGDKKTETKKTNIRGLYAEVKKAAYIRGCKIVEVTKDTAKDVHEELRNADVLEKMTKGRVREEFLYDYLSSLNGSYLEGASLLQDEVPEDDEYDPDNSNAIYVWEGLRVFVLKKDNKKGQICGVVVFHKAYLMNFPGPDEAHHLVDPLMMADNKNIATEIGHSGSKSWVDIPVLCGPGFGDILMGLVMAESKAANLLVNVGAGRSNTPMLKLLRRWHFKKLKVIHPETVEPWQDEDGYNVIMKFRKKPISSRRAAHIFDEYPLSKNLQEKREKKFIADKLKDEDHGIIEKLKVDHQKKVTKKNDEIAKIKEKLKQKDSEIIQLRKHIQSQMSNSAIRSKLLKALKQAF